jgi:hypothetical protein
VHAILAKRQSFKMKSSRMQLKSKTSKYQSKLKSKTNVAFLLFITLEKASAVKSYIIDDQEEREEPVSYRYFSDLEF